MIFALAVACVRSPETLEFPLLTVVEHTVVHTNTVVLDDTAYVDTEEHTGIGCCWGEAPLVQNPPVNWVYTFHEAPARANVATLVGRESGMSTICDLWCTETTGTELWRFNTWLGNGGVNTYPFTLAPNQSVAWTIDVAAGSSGFTADCYVLGGRESQGGRDNVISVHVVVE